MNFYGCDDEPDDELCSSNRADIDKKEIATYTSNGVEQQTPSNKSEHRRKRSHKRDRRSRKHEKGHRHYYNDDSSCDVNVDDDGDGDDDDGDDGDGDGHGVVMVMVIVMLVIMMMLVMVIVMQAIVKHMMMMVTADDDVGQRWRCSWRCMMNDDDRSCMMMATVIHNDE